MVKPKPLRKSVTFQSIAGEDAGLTSSSSGSKSLIPVVTNPVLIIPFHYPALIAGAFRFGLTCETRDVLVKSALTLVASQVVYGLVIRHNVQSPASKKRADREKSTSPPVRKDGKEKPLSGRKDGKDTALLIVASVVIAAVLSIPVFVFVILFGAPLASHLFETFLLSVHLSFLVLYPLLVLFKLDSKAFFSTFQLERVYRAIFTNPILTSSFLGLVGCWLGVIPIPLDWDRPWQAWPITLLTGAYLGCFAGSVISVPLLRCLSEETV